MKNRILFALLIILKGSSLFAYPSLFFTEDETSSILENLHESNTLERAFENFGKLYLSAIVYFDEDHWSLWVNNLILRPDTPQDIESFHLEAVTPKSVKFSWRPSDGSPSKTFTLHPHQTYIAKNEMIIDGVKK